MKKIKKIIRVVVSVIGYIIIFAMAAALVLILRGNIKGEVTFIAGKAVMWVKTPSMEPTIPERSYILIGKVNAADVKVGDVIVFRSDDPALGGAYNTHRVKEIVGNNAEFVTMGDNNYLPDKYTAKAGNIVGIYDRNLPVLSVLGRLLQTPTGVIIMVTIMFVIIIAIYVPDMIKATKERTELIEKKRREQIDALVKEEIEKLRAKNDQNKKETEKSASLPDIPSDAGNGNTDPANENEQMTIAEKDNSAE